MTFEQAETEAEKIGLEMEFGLCEDGNRRWILCKGLDGVVLCEKDEVMIDEDTFRLAVKTLS